VVSAGFPGAAVFLVGKPDLTQPFGGFPEIQVRDDQAHRPAMGTGQGRAIIMAGEEGIGMHEIGQIERGCVAVIGAQGNKFRCGQRLSRVDDCAG